MKKLFTLILILVAFQQVKAQQDVLVTQYMFNPLLLNPAYAGSKEYMMATLLYRKQWVNWNGAPETAIATIHGPVGLKALGWGLTLSHDHIGVTDRTDVNASFSYQLKLNKTFKLGMGIKAGGDFYSYKNSDLIYWTETDKVFMENTSRGFQPNIGAGAFLYSKRYYFGLSVPSLINYNPDNNISIDDIEIKPHQVRHYYITSGAVFSLKGGDDIIVKPSILMKYVPNAPVECDFNINFLFSRLLWVGASYRTGDSFVGLFEIQLSKQLRIGYSYDFTVTDINRYSNGTHEIMIGYDFGREIMKVRTPRYF
jgi:type IX secretion system PorP/SprF family membrane protein